MCSGINWVLGPAAFDISGCLSFTPCWHQFLSFSRHSCVIFWWVLSRIDHSFSSLARSFISAQALYWQRARLLIWSRQDAREPHCFHSGPLRHVFRSPNERCTPFDGGGRPPVNRCQCPCFWETATTVKVIVCSQSRQLEFGSLVAAVLLSKGWPDFDLSFFCLLYSVAALSPLSNALPDQNQSE